MAIPQNVAQQNAKLKAEIQRTVVAFVSRPKHLSWVGAILESRGLPIESGILVHMFETPEQDGNLVGGVWLTRSKEFWEIQAIVSRRNGELIEIEKFENISHSVVINQHLPGTGKSFGYLALEVLSETSGT